MTRRWGLVFVLAGALVICLLSSRADLWAAPGMDRLRQTVPTMTPTVAREPREEPDETVVVPRPTATPTETLQPTVAPSRTAEPSPTPTRPPAVSPTTTSEVLTPEPLWDFGDAPDPGFPSLLAGDGVRHATSLLEWLGEGVDQELDSRQVDDDRYDDGVEAGPFTTCDRADLNVVVTVANRQEPEHPYDAEHRLYLNVLVDWDADGSWGGRVSCPHGSLASEWAVRNLPIDVSSWPGGSTSAVVPLQFPAGPQAGQLWARFTLSYQEVIAGDDWDGRGAFSFGETEDYLLTVSQSPTETPQATSATGVAAATPTPTPIGPGWLSTSGGGLQLLLFFATGLLLGIALMAIWGGGKRRDWRFLAGGLVLMALLLLGWVLYYGPHLASLRAVSGQGSPTPHERLIPTPTATAEPTTESARPTPESPAAASPRSETPTREPSATPVPETGSVVATPLPSLMSTRDRFGFGVAVSPLGMFSLEGLHAGWYYNWGSEPHPARPQGMEFVQMIRVRGTSFSPQGQELDSAIRHNPGSLWLVGNEPDVIWQDQTAPSDYARVYHEVYYLLKGKDPSCQVAIAGVSQATPLRLQYLDMILDAYQDLYGETLPVDVWNVHGFILREERGSWGVDIPPGIAADQGRLYEISDHDDMEIFGEQIVAFRRWMRDKGERDKPLIVSEYGILMPAEYGFPEERTRDFMYATFDYFLTARDASLGCPADGNRLVQRWAWYSLSDTVYPTGNLFHPETGQVTALGLAYGSYTSSH